MGALGSDAAIEAADVVLMDDDPAKIALAMRIARRTNGIVYQNIVFALGVKGICLILGALGIASMWTAIFADVGVMIIAVLNATRALYIKDLAKRTKPKIPFLIKIQHPRRELSKSFQRGCFASGNRLLQSRTNLL